METLHPDVYTEEMDGTPVALPASLGTGGMIGVAKKGLADVLGFATSWTEFQALYGAHYQGNYLPHAARGFFDNQGSRAYFARVLGTGATKSTLAVLDRLAAALGTISAMSEGAWGDEVKLTTIKHSTLSETTIFSGIIGAMVSVSATPTAPGSAYHVNDILTVTGGTGTVKVLTIDGGGGVLSLELTTGGVTGYTVGTGKTTTGGFGTACTISITAVTAQSTEVTVAVINGFEIGDVVKCDDGTNTVNLTVKTINVSTRKLTFLGVLPTPSSIAIGATLSTHSRHKAQTTTAAALLTAGTSVLLTNSLNIGVGSILTIQGATVDVDVIVTGVSGNTVSFAAVTLGATIASGSPVSSQEFTMVIQEGLGEPETIKYLSMQDENVKDYVGLRLTGDGNESSLVDWTTITPSASGLRYQVPIVNQTVLASGADGSAPTDVQVLGSSTEGAKTGIYLFDDVKGVRMISAPGFTSEDVSGPGIDYCEARKDCVYIAEVPLTSDLAGEAEIFRKYTLNKASSYGALYYPWVKLTDPETSVLASIPPAGHVQGVWARVAGRRGAHKAPANEVINGIKGFTHTVSDGEQNLLSPIGVNCLRSEPGRGYRIMDAHTLWPNADGKDLVSTRNWLIFAEQSISEALKFAVQEPNNQELWDKMSLIAEIFLHGQWLAGAVSPSDNEAQAYFVKCDGELNTQAVRNARRVVILVGANVTPPAEFIIFRVTLWDGGQSVEELAAGAAA